MNVKMRISSLFPILFLLATFMACGTTGNKEKETDNLNRHINNKHVETGKKVYIAGGCFWGIEDLFRKQKGVLNTEVGYIGGENENPTYRNHLGHAEGIEITYDTTKTSFKEILDYFYRIHNPTTVDRQGNDSGSSYRSAIFYQNDEEKQIAQEVIGIVDNSKKWEGKVVTKLEPYVKFWPAEEEHQDYLQKHPNGYTCHYERFGTFLDK